MEWGHSYMQETKMPIKIPKLSYIEPWIVLRFTILAFKAYIVNIRRTLNVLIWSILNFNIDSGTTNRKCKSENNICLSNEKKKLWDRLYTFPYGLFYLQTHLQNMFHQPLPPPSTPPPPPARMRVQKKVADRKSGYWRFISLVQFITRIRLSNHWDWGLSACCKCNLRNIYEQWVKVWKLIFWNV